MADTSPARLETLLSAVRAGDRRALAQVLSVVEDGAIDDLRRVSAELHPASGNARVIGITGAPGVGKSTLTAQLVQLLRSADSTVAVIAVDPTSPFSGGALLGDRVRMQDFHADDGVFIRSMASRGHLGGLSFATPNAVDVLDAAGFDVVIVETVGVGQSEVEVAGTADTTVVVIAPGMGDGIQAAKAGILEVADVFAINKADHGGAGKTEGELRSMLELGHVMGATPWEPPIVRTVAVRGEGIEDLMAALDQHQAHLDDGGLIARREGRALHAIREVALEQIRGQMHGPEGDPLLGQLAARVARRELDPYSAADEVLAALDA